MVLLCTLVPIDTLVGVLPVVYRRAGGAVCSISSGEVADGRRAAGGAVEGSYSTKDCT